MVPGIGQDETALDTASGPDRVMIETLFKCNGGPDDCQVGGVLLGVPVYGQGRLYT